MELESWEKYQSQYTDFLFAIHQAELTTLASGSALKDFPRNLPESLRVGLSETMKQVARALGIVLRDLDSKKGGSRKLKSKKVDVKESPAFTPMLMLWTIRIKQKKDVSKIDFQSALFRQQLVMIIAHTEAFIGDSIRAICGANPKMIISSKKQVTWEVALSFQDRTALLDSLIEEFVSAVLQAKDIGKILAGLEKDLGLPVDAAPESMANLSLAEQVRHLIVHVGGRVDAKFIEKTKIANPVGTIFPVDEDFVKKTALACMDVGQSVFKAVSEKFFRVSDPLKVVGIKIRRPSKKKRSLTSDETSRVHVARERKKS